MKGFHSLRLALFLVQTAKSFSLLARCSISYGKKLQSRIPPLEAKRTKSNNKSGQAGGFGTTTKGSKRKVKKQGSKSGGSSFHDDEGYSVFPRLETHIQETLIPFNHESPTKTDEIRQRLAQIYGFPRFNQNIVQEESEPSSLTDLLKLDGKPASPTLGCSMPDSELSSLIAAATGGSRETLSPTDPVPSFRLDIGTLNQIPPFETVEVLHVDPLVLRVKDFFSPTECQELLSRSSGSDVVENRSPTVGKDNAARAQRTSTTFYHHYRNVPELISKASRLLGIDDVRRWEEPQTVRYRRSEKFTWHLDALGPSDDGPPANGGQRVATLLVYLSDLAPEEGGATLFRDLGGTDGKPLYVQPESGSALLFFPSAGQIPNAPLDIRTLHCGQAVSASAASDKWIAQLWLRESAYTPSVPQGSIQTGEALQEAVEHYCSKFAPLNS